MRKDLLYFLFSDNNKPYYLDNTGVILEGDGNWRKPDNNPASLQCDPDGWREATWQYARNPKVWGVFRDFSSPLNFAEDGREILRYLVWNFGSEVNCRLAILKLDKSSLPYNYSNVYFSELNFSKYREKQDYSQCETLEGGPSKYWKANEGQKYTIPVDSNPKRVKLYNDGMEINNKATFVITDGIDPNSEWRSHLVDLQVVQREVNIGGVYDVPRTVTAITNNLYQTKKFFFDATTDTTVNFSWDFELTVNYDPPAPAINPGASLLSVIRIWHKDGSMGNGIFLLQQFQSGINNIANKTYHVIGSGSLNVVEGDQLFFYTTVTPSGATGDAQCQFIYGGLEPFLKFEYTYRQSPTYISCLTPLELGKQLVSKMSDGKCDLTSNFLTTLPVLYSPADAVRGLPDTSIGISWRDYYQSLQQFGVMMYFRDKYFVIEKFDTAFQQGVAIDIGDVKDAEVYKADDLLNNSIKVGPPNQNYKEVNGRYEFNQPQQWSLPILRTQRELDLSTPVRTDAFGAEVLRINFEGKTTTDSESDNDTFMFSVVRTSSLETYVAELLSPYKGTTANYDVPYQSFVGVGFTPNTDRNQFTYTGGKQQVDFSVDIKVIKLGRENVTVTLYKNNTVLDAKTFLADGSLKTLVSPNTTIDTGDVIRVNVVYAGTAPTPDNDTRYSKITVTYLSSFVYNLLRPAYSSVKGIGAPTSVYNTMLRPRNSIINNGALIHSLMETYLDGKEVAFNSGTANTDFETTLNGIVTKESDNIKINSLNPILFKPWYIIFTTEMELSLFTIINMNPYQRIAFNWKGRKYYGFMWDGKVKIGNEDAQQWTLLAAPESDLKNFNSPI